MAKKRYSNRLKGKTAIITGIGAGIGQGCALMFAREGANVFGSDIDPKAAAATLEIARKEDLSMTSFHPTDMTNEAQVEAVVEEAYETFGRIDILVNAATFCDFKPIEKLDYETNWKKVSEAS